MKSENVWELYRLINNNENIIKDGLTIIYSLSSEDYDAIKNELADITYVDESFEIQIGKIVFVFEKK